MKKLLLSSALAISTLAVVMPTQTAMAQEVATVGSIGNGLDWVAKRVTSIEVGTLAYEMEQDGVTDRSYVAVFSLSGALVQNYELAGSKVGLEKVSRDVGFQILPYTVSIASDGRKFISVAAIALKDMNKAYKTVGTTEHYYRNRGDVITDDFWTVLNKLEALVYEYDDGLMINNTESHRLDFVRAEAKLDILGASTPGHFLAIVGQAGVGLEYQKINTPEGMIGLTSEDGSGLEGRSFHIKTGVGLEYNLPVGKNSNINASALFNWRKFEGHNYNKADKRALDQENAQNEADTNNYNGALENQYNNQVANYENDKEDYEDQNFDGQNISDETYQQLTGAQYPNVPEYKDFEAQNYNPARLSRTLMYITPSIKFNGKLSGSTRYELNVFGNIPLRDDVKGGNINLDLTGTNARPIVGAGLKVKF